MSKGLKTRKHQRLTIIIGLLASLSVAVFLVLFALGGDSLSLFLQPSLVKEKQASGELQLKQRFRLGGLVETGSFSRQDDGLTYVFSITDCATTIPVHFKGILPDLFREGQGVVTEGQLDETGTFTADTVLAKHDENYAPPGTLPTNADACTHPDAEKPYNS
ncbi:cytochrome c maturation protein CcmE [Kordiimonas sp. SCSIO 12610]|uniref:cytochrome c maturation protein CcmE n=1 Tax=Kordiimonas sp. SCSIO 12610 TaxID=2829597 RepID=UPI00210BDEDF|nr:cytochrome c maturation protein CcmE [Kordiimonas sp. SCSIO 12610]UTW55629.1 cytochrome c maturation protein CcmE [Kordiimonas sp. SCSIO 12610]